MVDPASGPFLFDTSAESWLGRTGETEVRAWLRAYLSHYEMQLSAVTVIERIRGYGLLWRRAGGNRSKQRASFISQTSGECGR